MAITRAQIPEQIDLFDEGGEVLSSLSPEDIIALYGAQKSAPITSTIQTKTNSKPPPKKAVRR